MHYGITAQLQVSKTVIEDFKIAGKATGSRQIPYFELNGSVQGIRDEEHAETIAREILDPLGVHGDKLRIWVAAIPEAGT